MPEKRFLIAANWKMHSQPQGWDVDDSPFRSRSTVDVVVFPTFVDIRDCVEKFMTVGAQYGRPEPRGAFTGDVSMQILAEHGCRYVLCGHSERRVGHGESDEFVAQMAQAAVDCGLIPVVCVGESLEQREQGRAEAVVAHQVQAIRCPAVFAYEPVWAIGTGKSATPEEAQDMHTFIRRLLPEERRETTRILYGGSVKPDNARAFFACPDVDGALVGGASLDPAQFRAIIDAIPLS